MIDTALTVGYAVSGTYVTAPDDTQLIYSAPATYTVTAYLISIPYVTSSPAVETQMGMENDTAIFFLGFFFFFGQIKTRLFHSQWISMYFADYIFI